VPPEQPFDAALARRWLALALAGIERDREAIDALNVYPVPDGDTGTNLHLTLRRAAEEVEGVAADADLATIAGAAAHGALLGARGNSGIITSQLLRGWAQALDGLHLAGPAEVAEALRLADEQAWRAVETPVEGTMLSVTRAAALEAARDGSRPLAVLVADVAVAGRAALARTTSQLDVLAEAGVVDAGGAGLVVVLDALAAAVTGDDVPPLPVTPGPVPLAQSCPSPGTDGPAYEVMYLLEVPPADEDALLAGVRESLGGLGDSLVVVGGSGLWHVHVHVDDHDAAVAAGASAGSPREVRVTELATGEVVRGQPLARRADDQPRDGSRAPGVAVVVCCTGDGLRRLYEDAGAVVVEGGSGARASTEELLAAVLGTGAAGVVLLPNDADTVAVARAAAEQAAAAGVRVEVVPTRAQVQGLAAVAVHDPALDPAGCAARMSDAAGAVRAGAVTVAARDAVTQAGPCRPGDVLGVVSGAFTVVAHDVVDVAAQVVARLLADGGELVTLVLGADAPDGVAEAVRAVVEGRAEPVEVQVLDGGQPRYPVLVGVE
jgi:DAK2 domain fusion protein YloV